MAGGRVFAKLRYASLLARRGGSGILLRQFLSRIHSASTYVWVAKDLATRDAASPARSAGRLRLASPDAIRRIMEGLDEAQGRDLFEILRRISFYDRGFDACYLLLTDTGDVCHIGWLLTPRHNPLIKSQYPPGTEPLHDGEALVENILTFPKYRGRGIMASVLAQMEDLAREQGARRMVAYIETTNAPSLAGFDRAGYKPIGREMEIRRFFRIRRTGQIGR